MECLIDDIDRQILACLVEDARMSLKVLSGRIGLTSPSTAERLKRLEERGVIQGYGARVNLAALGYTLQALVRDVPCKFNLIPFNPFPNSGYARSSAGAIRTFREILQEAGYVVTVRKTRGDDIDAACGQLAGKVEDKTRRAVRWLSDAAPE